MRRLLNKVVLAARNITNGWCSGSLKGVCPASSFVTVDRDVALKPPLAIVPTVKRNALPEKIEEGNNDRMVF